MSIAEAAVAVISYITVAVQVRLTTWIHRATVASTAAATEE